jgi:hypothetical protein
MAICLIFEAVLVLIALKYHSEKMRLVESASFLRNIRVLIGVMTILVIGVLVQVGTWAVLFILLGEFSEYEVAFYHSAVNFSTLGYGDLVMSEEHRLLGPLQAINGVLMIGVSTAIVMATVQDTFKNALRVRGE